MMFGDSRGVCEQCQRLGQPCVVPVGGRACTICRKHKEQCMVNGNAINRCSRAKKNTDGSREGSQKHRSRESSEEPDGRSQKWRRVQRKPIVIESNDESDELRMERFAQKAATEWSNGLMEQRMDKLEWQMGALSNLVIQLLRGTWCCSRDREWRVFKVWERKRKRKRKRRRERGKDRMRTKRMTRTKGESDTEIGHYM